MYTLFPKKAGDRGLNIWSALQTGSGIGSDIHRTHSPRIRPRQSSASEAKRAPASRAASFKSTHITGPAWKRGTIVLYWKRGTRMERPIIWPQNLRFESAIYSKHRTSRQTDRPGGRPLRRCAGAAAPVSCARRCALVFLPFQIHAAESRFVKPYIRMSKKGSHLLMDNCPTNHNLIIHRINLISRTFARSPSRKKIVEKLAVFRCYIF